MRRTSCEREGGKGKWLEEMAEGHMEQNLIFFTKRIVNINYSSSNRGMCMALMHFLELCSSTVNVMIKYYCISTRKKSSFF